MHILLLTQIVPFPPDSGPKIKTYHLLRSLAQRHRVTLVTFTRNRKEEDAAAALREICAAVHTVYLHRSRGRDALALGYSLLGGRPWLMERDDLRAMHRTLARLVRAEAAAGRPFDLVHADQLNMAQFAERLPLPRLLDQHNAVWTIFRRMALQARGPTRLFLEREWRLLKRYEGRVCREFEAVTAVSHEDRQFLFEAMGGERDMPVIPIAIDAEAQPLVPREPGARGILSLATMMWPPNVDGVLWYAREIHPLVRQAAPDSRFYVVGQRPVAEVRALPERDPSIEVTGYVPDATPYIARSACLIVPLRSGGGMRVKILEALARGIPVVSTTIGYEGIDLTPGEHLLVADTPAEFAAAVTRLLGDPSYGARIAEAGRRRLLERYDWRAVCPAMDAVYARMVPGASASSTTPFVPA
ncbi:MAG TPA: glycosyltransferase [Roseiflexaceae bacterium]|nr:glycosyltransferase [Roseiflexaceae bacterium]